MAYFPVFIELKEEWILLAGGGRVAFRKIQKLIPYGARILVIAPEILSEIEQMPEVCCIKREFEKEDLERHPRFVIAATNKKEVNAKISEWCKEKNIPVNVVDDVENCSFVFPALVKKGEFSAGICTGGASPTASVYYKEYLQEKIPDSLDEILKWLEGRRAILKEQVPEQSKRATIFRRLFEMCMTKGRPLFEEEWKACIEERPIGSVALVGAGCGKADLITVRGLRLLQQCEAVVYDDLIDPKLLESVPESALRVYVGKRSGEHSASQEEINQILIRLAKSGYQVVRLKGGDPYLFGRGGEEMQALFDAGISCQEVPGIPSAIGIPAEAGIPVTHRGLSRGLHIVTAHTSNTEDGLPEDFDQFATLSGTLVFLMGLRQLSKIVTRLIAAGKSTDTPAAVISGGNSKNPARVRGTLATIEKEVQNANVISPAIILIGEVATLDFCEQEKPLQHVTIGITGTEIIAKKQQMLLGTLGGKTSWVVRSVVKERNISFDLQTQGKHVRWFVFTSANGVRIFFQQMEKQGICKKQMKDFKFAVIGEATGKVLESYGIKPELCPDVFTSEALANALVAIAKPEEEIVLFRSSIGSLQLVEIPTKAGLKVTDVPIYDLEVDSVGKEDLNTLQYLTFSSASGVRLFFQLYEEVPEHIRYVCIGEVTAQELRKYGKTEILVAREALVESVVETIVEDVEMRTGKTIR